MYLIPFKILNDLRLRVSTSLEREVSFSLQNKIYSPFIPSCYQLPARTLPVSGQCPSVCFWNVSFNSPFYHAFHLQNRSSAVFFFACWVLLPSPTFLFFFLQPLHLCECMALERSGTGNPFQSSRNHK